MTGPRGDIAIPMLSVTGRQSRRERREQVRPGAWGFAGRGTCLQVGKGAETLESPGGRRPR